MDQGTQIIAASHDESLIDGAIQASNKWVVFDLDIKNK
jgi:hypothetical protein